ncbi:MAG TPA: hypothetical protein VI548_13440 [Chitinophagaceae bacterium]|nr:hypothetical protein [Chitinophagaceae bacterium]
MEKEKKLSEKESLELITMMINKAKSSFHDTGFGAIMWGAVIAVCSLVRLSEIHFHYKLPFDIYLLTLAAIIPQIFITIKEKKERKVKSYDDIYMDYLWLGFGISIFLLIHISNNIFSEWGSWADEFRNITGRKASFNFYEYVSPLFLMLYGMPTFVTGAACKFKPMLWGGIFCWVCSILTVYTPVKTDLLLTASSAIMAWLIPGILMEKEYRIYKKHQASVNV